MVKMFAGGSSTAPCTAAVLATRKFLVPLSKRKVLGWRRVAAAHAASTIKKTMFLLILLCTLSPCSGIMNNNERLEAKGSRAGGRLGMTPEPLLPKLLPQSEMQQPVSAFGADNTDEEEDKPLRPKVMGPSSGWASAGLSRAGSARARMEAAFGLDSSNLMGGAQAAANKRGRRAVTPSPPPHSETPQQEEFVRWAIGCAIAVVVHAIVCVVATVYNCKYYTIRRPSDGTPALVHGRLGFWPRSKQPVPNWMAAWLPEGRRSGVP